MLRISEGIILVTNQNFETFHGLIKIHQVLFAFLSYIRTHGELRPINPLLRLLCFPYCLARHLGLCTFDYSLSDYARINLFFHNPILGILFVALSASVYLLKELGQDCFLQVSYLLGLKLQKCVLGFKILSL